MSNNIEQYRLGFEVWARGRGYSLESYKEFPEYRNGYTQAAWEVWTAAKREASTEPSAPFDGWTFQRDGDLIVVEHPAIGRTALSRDEKRTANIILYHLLESLEVRAAGAQKDEAKDAERLDWLEMMANQPGGLHLHDGDASKRIGRRGLGLSKLGRTLRQAIDDARALSGAGSAHTKAQEGT